MSLMQHPRTVFVSTVCFKFLLLFVYHADFASMQVAEGCYNFYKYYLFETEYICGLRARRRTVGNESRQQYDAKRDQTHDTIHKRQPQLPQ